MVLGRSEDGCIVITNWAQSSLSLGVGLLHDREHHLGASFPARPLESVPFGYPVHVDAKLQPISFPLSLHLLPFLSKRAVVSSEIRKLSGQRYLGILQADLTSKGFFHCWVSQLFDYRRVSMLAAFLQFFDKCCQLIGPQSKRVS